MKLNYKRTIFVGFAILMFGMDVMSDAVSPLADMPEFGQLLIHFKNPIVGVIIGTLFTAAIQSSAASVGILQALSLAGGVTYGMALPIIRGQNIGTCVTALLSSIGVNRNAKKVAVVHISFNLIGTAIFLILFYGLDAFLHSPSPIGRSIPSVSPWCTPSSTWRPPLFCCPLPNCWKRSPTGS